MVHHNDCSRYSDLVGAVTVNCCECHRKLQKSLRAPSTAAVGSNVDAKQNDLLLTGDLGTFSLSQVSIETPNSLENTETLTSPVSNTLTATDTIQQPS